MGNMNGKKEFKKERKNLKYETKIAKFGPIKHKTVYSYEGDQKKLLRRSVHLK